MSVAPAEPTPTDPAPAAVATPPEPVKPNPAATQAAEPPEADDGDDTPNVIKALREDFKAERARRQAAEQKAADARTELTNDIAKALGIVKDEPLDPAKLTESLTTAQTEAKQARVALAVYQNAGSVGDPVALLDSTTFLKKVAGIDPDDTAAIQAAIAAAVTANPRLGAATDPKAPAPNPAQGAGASGALGLDAQIDAAQKAGDIQLAIALKQQRAAALTTK